MPSIHQIPGQESIETVDCQYFEPLRMSSYLIEEAGRAAFVDNNTRHAAPLLIAALEKRGLEPEAVDYLIVTHIHLDHAGGTSALLELCPSATVLAHPRAMRHLEDPSRLIAGVKAVYGEDFVERVYGRIDPIAADRIRGMDDEETIEWGGRTLRFMQTRGHANHHICIHDSRSNAVFTGDSFGLGRSGPGHEEIPYVICSATPIDFDPEQARLTAGRLLDLHADVMYLAHYGALVNQARAAEQLLSNIEQHEEIMCEAIDSRLGGEELTEYCTGRVREAMIQHRRLFEVEKMDDVIAGLDGYLEWFGMDIRLNGMGVAAAAERRRAKEK